MAGWFTAKSPITAAEQEWIENHMPWFVDQFGASWLRSPVVLPTEEFFPGGYTGTEQDMHRAVRTVSGFMGVQPGRISVRFDAGSANHSRGNRVATTSGTAGWHSAAAAATYRSARKVSGYRRVAGRGLISLDRSLADKPLLLLATIAHEVATDRLVGEKRIPPTRADRGPLADLLTVYLGLGVIAANAAFEFDHVTDPGNPRTSRWSANRLGHLTEPMYGYALARYALLREEQNPMWARSVDTNPRTSMKRAGRYLKRTTKPTDPR